MIELGRRSALALFGFTATLPAMAAEPGFLAAAADPDGAWRAAAFDLDGRPRFELPIPARGHGGAVSPDGETALLFARRPGSFALVVDLRRGTARRLIGQATERWFCGHGAFSADGSLLYASEIDGNGDGVIGVYAAGRDFDRIGEFRSGGADPHDVRLSPDRRHLLVANGGIRTDPRLPRARFDLEDIDSAVSVIEAASGRIRQRITTPDPEALLSLRHLALGAGGEIYIAMQHEGPRFERAPLIAVADGTGFAFIEAPDAVWDSLDHYTGSAAASPDGSHIAVTSPRGGVTLVVETATRRVVASVPNPDGSGVAARGSGFVLTSGLGGALSVGADGDAAALPGAWVRRLRWDNHLVRL